MKDAAKRGAERAAERETAERADRAVSGAFDKADEAVKCTVTDAACAQRARDEGQEVVYVDDSGNEVPAPSAAPAPAASAAPAAASGASARPGEGAWANYDFVPGDRVLFYDDFERDRVGDFPRRLEFGKGSMEIVEWDAGRALRAKTGATLRSTYPKRSPSGSRSSSTTTTPTTSTSMYVGGRSTQAVGGSDTNLRPPTATTRRPASIGRRFKAGSVTNHPTALCQEDRRINDQTLPIRVAVDGSYAKVYINENRVANIPTPTCGADPRSASSMDDVRKQPVLHRQRARRSRRAGVYVREVERSGRLALGGLLFDTGSATLQPESSPTLSDMTQMMRKPRPPRPHRRPHRQHRQRRRQPPPLRRARPGRPRLPHVQRRRREPHRGRRLRRRQPRGRQRHAGRAPDQPARRARSPV